LPAAEVQKRISLFASMPAPVLRLFAEKLGLDFVIANVNPGEFAKPKYLEDGTLSIPETMKSVIVLAFEMDYELLESAPTTRGDAALQKVYSDMAITAASLAVFIRSLGFNAIPCGNNTALSVPQAIDAGLGEMGRNGILITPKYGPRVRLAKVITDLPLVHDQPIQFGVEEFCKVCKKCAELCPTKAISFDDEKSYDVPTISANPGVLKWTINAEDCYSGWFANGSGCSVCIQVCPFNKPEGWLHEITRIMIGADNGSVDNLLVKLDTASGYGEGKPKFTFWENKE
jgi:reductive dehalogenase